MIRVLILSVVVGCSGTIGDPNAGDGPGGRGPHGEVEIPEGGASLHRALGAPERCEDGVSPRAVRRLSGRQFRNSLVALFDGDVAVPDADVLDDPVAHGFRVDADAALVRDLGAQRIMQHAERVAT